jgi:Zn-dependent protease with chaperone function
LIRGVFFDGERSRGVAAEVEIDAAKRVRLVLVEASEGGGAPERKGHPREWTRPLAEVEISERIANIPRRIVLTGVGAFETPDNDGVDRALAPHGHGPGLVHWLETRWPIAIASLVAVALGSFLFVRFGLPAIADLAARTLPASVDRVLGARTLELLDQVVLEPSKLPEDRQRALESRFAAMAQPLEDGHDDRLVLRVAPSLGPNAVALPSGIVVMTDELVLLAEDDEELVAVLAHELGHVRGRHALRQLLQSTGVSAVAFALLGDVSSASAFLGAVPALLQAKNSRDFEREADSFAKGWLVRNDIDPIRFDAILCRMQRKAGGDEDSGFARYLASHPATNERAHCDAARSPIDRYFDDAKAEHAKDVRAEALRELKADAQRDAREELRRGRAALAPATSEKPEAPEASETTR